jgi:hypothetical protein
VNLVKAYVRKTFFSFRRAISPTRTATTFLRRRRAVLPATTFLRESTKIPPTAMKKAAKFVVDGIDDQSR